MMLKTLQRSSLSNGAAFRFGGTGEPVILLHGVGLRAEAWKPQIDRLSRRWSVYAFDLPGHGRSRLSTQGPDLTDYVDWMHEVLQLLDLGPVNIAGHSMGALIALGTTAEQPAMIRRLAMLNGVYRRSAEASRAVCERAAQISRGDLNVQQPLERWFTKLEADRAARVQTGRMLAGVDPKAYAAAYNAFARGDGIYAGRLPAITCPTLFLTGDGDPNSTAGMAREMAAVVPRGRAVIIEGHRHMVGLTAADRVNEALISWLGEKIHDDD